MSAPTAFMATGTPSEAARSAASAAECTRPPAGTGHAVGGEDLLRCGLVERGAAGRERLLDDLMRPRERVVDLDGIALLSSARVDAATSQLHRW